MAGPPAQKLCPSCGTTNPIDANVCYKCGHSYHSGPYSRPPSPGQPYGAAPPKANPGPYANPNYQQPTAGYYRPDGYDGYNTSSVDGMAIASLIVGILALLGFCVWCLSVPLAIVGLVLGVFGLRGRNRGLAMAGMICSGVSILGSIAVVAFTFSPAFR